MKSEVDRKPTRYKPNTVEWTAQRLREGKLPKAVGLLRAWMPSSRVREASEETVTEIRSLNWKKAVEAVKSLKGKKSYVRGTRGKSLRLPVIVETLEDNRQIVTQGLLDSGATGSCIDSEFVKRHRIPTKDLPIKTPVYNADGTLNEAGSIHKYVEVRMTVGDHSERIQFGVTSLG
ncbi:hypothetical protein F5880DRAFT_1489894, partial [Lentinula raphanica]